MASSLIIMQAVELAYRLQAGIILDRREVKQLLRKLEVLDSQITGCVVMKAQLRGILARKDWLTISIQADRSTVQTTGVSIGIVDQKPQTPKARLSPLQRWQRRNGLDRR